MKKSNHRSVAKKLSLHVETLRVISGGSHKEPIKVTTSCNDPLCTLGSVASDCCNPITNAC